MSQVFEPSSLSGMILKNRIIRSATHEGFADQEGRPTQGLIGLYRRLAEGGVGAIITGEAAVQSNGRSSGDRVMMIHRDDFIEDYQRVTKAVHEYATPIILQLQHCGRQTSAKATGKTPVAPSAIRDKAYWRERPRALTEGEIEEIIENFIRAMERAREAGFDGVQLHAAHGYLLSDFLSPHANRRRDRWGGSPENRFRIIREIYGRARKRVGSYPVLVKINAYDFRRNGIRLKEAIGIASLLEGAGCDAIEVSCGTYEDGLSTIRGPRLPLEAAFAFVPGYRDFSPLKKRIYSFFAPILIKRHKPLDNYNVPAAEAIKQRVKIPVMVVGGIKRLNDIEDIVAHGRADYVSLCRPLIIEPDLVSRFQSKRQSASRCISCNYCFLGLQVAPLRCYHGKIGT
jgi:2,4-dienoyl-CoA reductase-like NADH-dependent reductase (Old Yellow Enzyme family)